jgi:hypothetical protein
MLRAVLIVFALRLPGWFATMPEVDVSSANDNTLRGSISVATSY